MSAPINESTKLFLSQAELQELTNRVRRTSQATVLKSLGIEHRIRPDGSVIVLRAHVERLLGGAERPGQRAKVYQIDRSTL
ncbi:DUF4224 domain-containing protein [Jeongeupia chitinilytica]|uniref:DUF4224 domain-containing protein n=1 Tax=Jeongeupia chitinilytica TaxID=1041641 RepID=A0ABQ3GXB3_9NEIS|nr:DUF4224 domain-containing protein [Jeongeupia chitinilytica]GHD59736.1 hypothetical protein GCM10007350_11390 [Jeongeupia chitinilytica]